MNKRIQSLWIGETLSNNEIMCIKSYLINGHDFFLYVYGDVKNVPSGVTLMDANCIIEQNKIFKDSANTFASFADWFRIKLLFFKGGWWVDMDTICLKHFDFKEQYCIASERDKNTGLTVVNNGFLNSECE